MTNDLHHFALKIAKLSVQLWLVNAFAVQNETHRL